MTSLTGYNFDGLISSEQQVAIRMSWTPPALPSTANNFDSIEWYAHASCKGLTEKFFRHSCCKRCLHHPQGCSRIRNVRECKEMCASCPVLEHCRRWALNTDLPYGLAGAMTESERLRWQDDHPSPRD